MRYELTEDYLDLQVVGPVETGMPLPHERDASARSVAQQPRRNPLRRGLHMRNSEVGLERRHKLQTLGRRLTDLSVTGRWMD